MTKGNLIYCAVFLTILNGSSYARGEDPPQPRNEATNEDFNQALSDLGHVEARLHSEQRNLMKLLAEAQKVIAQINELKITDQENALTKKRAELREQLLEQQRIIRELEREHERETLRVQDLERALEGQLQ